MTENAKKKKRKTVSSVTVGMGNPLIDIKQFNKELGDGLTDKNQNCDTCPSTPGAVASADNIDNAAPNAASAGSSNSDGVTSSDAAVSAGGEGGGMGEALKQELTEKRETKRYYVRPQHIFCANKADVLKALIDVSEAGENCSVYSLKRLADHDDVHKLTNNDIIYYYDDNVLYDKNHVMVMDYDLFIKHEEERKRIKKDPDQLTKAELDQNYDDRMTKNTFVEDLQGKINYNDLKLAIDRGEEVELGSTDDHADSYFGADFDNGGRFPDGGTYGDTEYVAYLDNGKYCLAWTDFSDDGGEGQSDIKEYDSFEDLVSAILNIEFTFSNLDLDDFTKYADQGTVKENLTESMAPIPLEAFKLALDRGEEVDLGYGDGYGGDGDYWVSFDDHAPYSDTGYTAYYHDGKYVLRADDYSADGDSKSNDSFGDYGEKTYDTIEELLAAIKSLDLTECNIELPDEPLGAEEVEDNPFNQTFEAYDPFGNKLTEAKNDDSKVCCICGEEYEGYGNNAEPYKKGYCCDACQIKFVIPSRLALMNKNNGESSENNNSDKNVNEKDYSED